MLNEDINGCDKKINLQIANSELGTACLMTIFALGLSGYSSGIEYNMVELFKNENYADSLLYSIPTGVVKLMEYSLIFGVSKSLSTMIKHYNKYIKKNNIDKYINEGKSLDSNILYDDDLKKYYEKNCIQPKLF